MTDSNPTQIGIREHKALVTVETMDRLARRAASLLRNGKPHHAAAVLASISDEAQVRMATAVKTQELSDTIAAEAAARVQATLTTITAACTYCQDAPSQECTCEGNCGHAMCVRP